MHFQLAREHAIRYMKEKRIDPAKAKTTCHEGYGGPGEPGYCISYGVMTVPSPYGSNDNETHEFDVAALAVEMKRGQGDLFGFGFA